MANNIFKDNILATDIWNKKYRVNNESYTEWLNRITNGDGYIQQLIQQKKFIFGGRILANRGTGINSLSNCYTLGAIKDNLPAIMDACKNLALTYKVQGGQGLSLSLIRPKGAKVQERFTSDGIIPFMEMFNKVTESISQGAGRRGALLMSLDATHAEIENFIKIKSDLGKINNANLSVELDDEFMEAVQCYYETGKRKVLHITKQYEHQTLEYDIIPIDIFMLIAKHACEFAEPGVLFMNKFKHYNLNQFDPSYRIECCNPCSEQPLPTHGACVLSAINLGEYVLNPWTENVQFDYRSLTKDLKYIYRAMNEIVDEGMDKHALREQREIAYKYRNIGIGYQGLADVFIKFMTPYGSDKSKQLVEDICKCIFVTCLFLNIKFGRKQGSFPEFSKECHYEHTDIIRNAFKNDKIPTIDALRNCSMLTVAPTGSISNLFNCSSGIEPHFALQYIRKTKMGGTDIEYTVIPEVVNQYLALHPEDNIDNLPYYFVTAMDINPTDRIDIQAIAQKYNDSAISSTLNLPKETTTEEIAKIYYEAWKKGLKGCTIYRDGSRDPILYTQANNHSDESDFITDNQAPKRPRELQAELSVQKAKGNSYAVIVGLLHGRPYEIFAFEMPEGSEIKPTNGKIIKIKRGQYKFESEFFSIDNLQLTTDKIEERAITILCSQLLRHGVNIQYIIKTAKKVNPVITSFTSTVCRVLGKYLNSETDTTRKCPQCSSEIIREGGCVHCSKCEWSQCNLLIKKRNEC